MYGTVLNMRSAVRWIAAGLGLGLAVASGAQAADFELTVAETARVENDEIVIRATLEPNARRGTVRAAMLIDAPPAVVFEMMTRCADALKYVPHLKQCRIRERAADQSWELVEHEIDLGWYSPRIRYVLRADIVPDQSITFRQVSGDFKANHGIWELEPVEAGHRTLLRYRVYLDPPGYVPTWLARSTFKRELPQMLTDLRRHCEAEQALRVHASATPN
jgi:ribosome-associated toxin RatA of RatAB toxin-antitoxin module